MDINKQRNVYFDFLKGTVICLVILGHSIQFGSGTVYLSEGSFFEDFLFRLIYCFHMPVFMMISGYFFSISVQKYAFLKLVKRQIMHLLIPIVLWGTISYLLTVLRRTPIYFSLKEWQHDIMFELWFLWAIFYSSMAVVFVRYFLRDSIFIYILGWLAAFILPDSYNLSLYKFMYPFFVIAYFMGKNKEYIKGQFQEKIFVITVASGIITAILFPFFHYDAYIYTSGYRILDSGNQMKQIIIDIYRMMIGFSGSIFWGGLMYLIYRKIGKENMICKLFAQLGYKAMGIYIISGYVFQRGLRVITGNFTPNYFVNALETGIILIICFACTKVMMKFRVINRYFLGAK